MAEASDFKCVTQLGFAKPHHKITPRVKRGADFGLGKLAKILEFAFNISATAEATDFKFGTLLEFAKAHHKITPREKSGHDLGLGQFPNILGFPYNRDGQHTARGPDPARDEILTGPQTVSGRT